MTEFFKKKKKNSLKRQLRGKCYLEVNKAYILWVSLSLALPETLEDFCNLMTGSYMHL